MSVDSCRLNDYDFTLVLVTDALDIPWNTDTANFASLNRVCTDILADGNTLCACNAKVGFCNQTLAKVLIGVSPFLSKA